MKEKPFVYRDNRALHEKAMKENTRIAITQRNIEFTLAHQHDSLEELSCYLRQCKQELGHIPAQAEIIGGDLLVLRFGSWVEALNYSGYVNCTGPAVNGLPLERTALFEEEYARQSAQHAHGRKARKK